MGFPEDNAYINNSYIIYDDCDKSYRDWMAVDAALIGERIREYRLRGGLSQRDLADRSGVSEPSVVSNWERGKQVPRLDTAHRIAVALGVDVGQLVESASGPPETNSEPVDAERASVIEAVARLPSHHLRAVLRLARDLAVDADSR